MFSYNTLTSSRKAFIDAAMNHFPELGDVITSKQIVEAHTQAGLPYPQWLSVPGNKAGKAMYHFPRPTGSAPAAPQETDQEITARLRETYESMNELVKAVASNTVNSLVIAGGAGLGKSYTVNKTLKDHYGSEHGFVFHRGYLRATHLFRLLYENRHKGMTVVLDDCDIWNDETALNILKAALELKETRRIGWGSEKIFLDEDGEEIPRYFDFEGCVIFLTNLNVRDMINSGSKMAPHLAAIESRSLVLDMKVKTRKEYLIIIKMKLEEGLLSSKGFTAVQEFQIMNFVEANIDRFSELSLRMIEKLGQLLKASPNKWESLAKNVCFR